MSPQGYRETGRARPRNVARVATRAARLVLLDDHPRLGDAPLVEVEVVGQVLARVL